MENMRRCKQALSNEACYEILNNATNGILCLNDDGQPYGVPVSYVNTEDVIYIHCAKQGRKIRILQEDNKVCFTVVGKDEIVPEKFTSYYQSVMIFGKAEMVEDAAEVKKALELLCEKYSPDIPLGPTTHEIDSCLGRVGIIKISIDEISGKQAKELMLRQIRSA